MKTIRFPPKAVNKFIDEHGSEHPAFSLQRDQEFLMQVGDDFNVTSKNATTLFMYMIGQKEAKDIEFEEKEDEA